MVRGNQSLNSGLRVPADKRFLDIFRVYVLKMASIAGLSDLDAQRLELAAEEAFMNTLEHAYPDGSPGDVFLKVEIGKTELTLSIRDEGLPFDQSPESYPEPQPLNRGWGSNLSAVQWMKPILKTWDVGERFYVWLKDYRKPSILNRN